MNLILKNGRILDPASGRDEIGDIVIQEDRIRDLGPGIAAPGPGTLDCTGMIVCPGLIDLHVHLREPGFEYKETIETGTRAAVAGGFTAVCAMPNTNPVNDNAGTTAYLLQRARELSSARVYAVGAITVGSRGEALASIGDMHRAGAVALSDDGRPVMNAQILRRAMEYASMFNMPVIQHSEDLNLSAGGAMHEGEVSLRLGLPGISGQSESTMIARDVLLAGQTGAHLHVAHISSGESIEAVRQAKKRGIRVTAEVTPHHLTLIDEDIKNYDANFKMNPPLRSRADRQILLEALADGTIDIIATDHAPHAAHEKQQEFTRAPMGIIGLETALPLTLRLVEQGHISLMRAIEALTSRPASIANLPGGKLQAGAPADVTVFDPNLSWTLDPAQGRSKSRNTPFAGWNFKGRAVYTVVGGRLVYQLHN